MTTRPLRILIVDDLPMNLKLLRAQLEAEGHTVTDASNGVEALAVLESQEIELIVSDILMPVMDGYRLCYEVRHHPRFQDLPFIAYTASYVSHSDEKLSLDLGADKYLRKPAPLGELLQAISDALANPGHRPVATLDTTDVLKEYSERLVAKLEKRNRELLDSAEQMREQGAALSIAVTIQKDSEEKLREANEQLRDLLDHSPAVTYALTLAGETVTPRLVSENITRLLGFSMAESLTMQWWAEHVHPDDRLRAISALGGTVTRGSSFAQYRLRHKDGTYRWIDDNQRLVRNAAGLGAQVVGVWTDITERREAQASLRESEARLGAIFEASRDGILVEDDGVIVFANASYAQILGFDKSEDLLGKHISEIAAADDIVRLTEYGKARVRGEIVPSLLEFKVRRRDGSFVELEGAVSTSSVAGKRYVTTAVRDITERKRAETFAREQASLIDQAHDAIVVRDLDDRITFWSKGAERLYGWQRSDAVGRRLDELLNIDAVEFATAAETALKDGVWSGEVEKTTAAGQLVAVDCSWTLLRDDEGQPKAIFSIDTNITDRKILERQFFRAQRLDSLGTLAGGIAHDLNNLLMPILMGVTMLKKLGPDERSLKAITNMERSVKRGADLVQRVLSFAKGSEGAREAVNLGEIVAEVEAIAESTFPKNIAFTTTMPDSLCCAIGDQTQLTQVLLNLCVNARDAMPGGGTLSISAAEMTIDHQYAVMHGGTTAGDYVVLEVTDNGSGIPKEVVDRIFEPFFTTKDVGKGTGLGLSTVQGVLRGHGGFIDVASAVGTGTTFRVYLPSHADHAAAGDIETEVGTPPCGNGELILVVDDEAPILEITRQTLEAFGYAVLTAEDGAQAISLYTAHRDDVAIVITDMMMPVMDGPALIAELFRINPGVKIIAASGLNANAEPVKGGAEVKHFLAKPYSADCMLILIRSVLSSEPTALLRPSVCSVPVLPLLAAAGADDTIRKPRAGGLLENGDAPTSPIL